MTNDKSAHLSFPADLAVRIRKGWAQLIAGDYSPPALPNLPLLKQLLEVAYLAQVTHLRDSFRNFRDRNIVSEAFVGFLGRKADVVKTRPLASR